MPREPWTDERLDDLEDGMHREFARLRTEMKDGFDSVDARFEKVDARFEKVEVRFEGLEDRLEGLEGRFEGLEDRFAALNRTLIAGAFAVCGAILAAGAF